MMRVLLFLSVTFFSPMVVQAQCPVVEVDLPSEVCLEASFLIENNTIADEFEWDLCPVDLRATPSVSKVVNTGLSSTLDFIITQDGANFYGFALEASTNSLIRLDFGNSRDNVPAKVNLGNVEGLFQFPNSIVVFREGGDWLGIVANGGNEKIVVLNFGSSLSNVPAADILHSRAGGGFANIAIAQTTVGSALLIAEFNARQVTVLNYPEGFLMPQEGEQAVAIAGSSPIDIQLVNRCDGWTALVLSFEDHKLHRLDFADSFIDAPVLSSYALTLNFEPYRLAVATEGDAFHAFVSSTSGGLSRLDFENDLTAEPAIIPLGTFGVLSNSRSLFIDVSEGQWAGFTINFSDGDLYRLKFQGNCGVVPSYIMESSPGPIQYTSAGPKTIAVTAISGDGLETSASYSLNVRNERAPDFAIVHQNSCLDSDILFDTEASDGTIAGFEWDFGDGSSSTIPNPSHRFFSSGQFEVTLVVTGNNSCVSRETANVNIFQAPVSDFLLPTGSPVCTNQVLEFVNNSDYDELSDPYWRWFVNSIEVSDQQNLTLALSNPGPHTIKLVAGVPGCESESVKAFGPLMVGPSTGFEASASCEGQLTSFQNLSTGDIEAFEWNFGDGNFSDEVNPNHLYSARGEYTVELVAHGASGCAVTHSETIFIRANPTVGFSSEGPPSSCSGVPAYLINNSTISDGQQIVEWNWEFNDPNDPSPSAEKDARHTFLEPGIYSVSLTATTDFGCQSDIEKDIEIKESPTADITSSPACDDLPVVFNGPTENIAYWYWEIGNSYYYDASPTHTFPAPGEYRVYTEFYALNGCVSTNSATIHVPKPLQADFSVVKNCVGHETVFTDITTGNDPVVGRTWDFGDGTTGSGSPATRTFTQTGTVNIALRVTAESGCSYERIKPVQILTAPVASFTVSPEAGAYPLEALFTNTSVQSNAYLWEFLDGQNNTSVEESPSYTFAEEGTFEVRLTATNTQQCEDTFIGSVTTVSPLPDADVELINLLYNSDGSVRVIVTINNKGNTILSSLPVTLDFGGKLTLRQIVDDKIMPGSMFNLVLNTSILDPGSLRYLCVSLDVPGDLNPDGNRLCEGFKNQLLVFPVYPNPVTGSLSLEWISPGNQVRVMIADGVGKQVFTQSLATDSGLNRRTINVEGFDSGLYFLVADDGVTRVSQRIVIRRP